MIQLQLEDTKKAREDAYEKYVASRLGFSPAANMCQTYQCAADNGHI